MIVTVTANAAIDRTLRVRELVTGTHVPLLDERVQAGGKGVNVARALSALGVETRCVVVVGGASGRWIVHDLEASGLEVVAVEAAGESRTCLEIVEEASGGVAQLHGRGVEASAETLDALLAACREALEGARWVALCGSLAVGLPPESSARIVELARARDVRAALDTSGPSLASGIAAAPDLLRVNLDEISAAFGLAPDAIDRAQSPELAALRLGIVSDGARPVRAWSRAGEHWRLTPPEVSLRNPVGCGDAMLAGVLAALEQGRSARDALRFGVALGSADAESDVAGRPDPRRARALVDAVKCETVPSESPC